MSTARHWVEPYDIAPGNPCYCGHPLTFGDCCGSKAAARRRPHGVWVVHDFLSRSACRDLIALAEQQPRERLKISVPDPDRPAQRKTIPDTNRIAELFDTSAHQETFDGLARRACQEYAEEFFQNTAEWFEHAYALRYSQGGQFNVHADAEVYDQNEKKFFRSSDRDVSLLIYLNDDYEGGELAFTLLNYTYKPRQGDLLMFPPTHLYTHRSNELRSGVKYTVVSWAALKGTPRMYPRQASYVDI